MTGDSEAVRASVREWLAARWRPGRAHSSWMADVVDAGWACPTWPREWYGQGLPPDLARVVVEEFAACDAPGAGQDLSNLAANTILAFGSDNLKHRYLRSLLVGEVTTCLLYSEPGAGSDLAALQTRAVADGARWVVNGQKVWSSGAHIADYGLLVARTDWDVPKHRGITYFLLPMKQSGIDVRPIRQMTGEANFNEVFLDDAEVPVGHVIGEVNDGWRVLQTALAYERLLMGSLQAQGGTPGTEEDFALVTADSIPPTTVEGGADFVGLARAKNVQNDALVRQRIAKLYSDRMVNRWNSQRAKVGLAQGSSSSHASLGKLAMSHILHSSARINAATLGPEAMLTGPEHAAADAVNRSAMTAFVNSIGGGSDQIQRNIIGERILGLPREPELDRDVPFREVRKAEATRSFGVSLAESVGIRPDDEQRSDDRVGGCP